MTKPLGVGIVGANVKYGWGTRAQIPGILPLEELRLVAVSTTRQETADETARTYGIPHAYDYVEALANDPEVDLVSVCVRGPAHYEVVRAVIDAGKHVYCEWPLGINVQQTEELRDLAEAKGVRHMIGLQAQGSPEINYMRDLVAGGYLGEVLSSTLLLSRAGLSERPSSYRWAFDRTQGVNNLTIAGGHNLDALCYCLGEFREVSATVATRVHQARISDTGEVVPVTAPDQLIVNGELESGAVVSVHIEQVPVGGTGLLWQVHGSEGALVLTSAETAQFGPAELRGARKGGQLTPLDVPGKYRWSPDSVPDGVPYNIAQMFLRLAEAIRAGKPATPDFNHAVKRYRLLTKLEEASETGKRVTL